MEINFAEDSNSGSKDFDFLNAPINSKISSNVTSSNTVKNNSQNNPFDNLGDVFSGPGTSPSSQNPTNTTNEPFGNTDNNPGSKDKKITSPTKKANSGYPIDNIKTDMLNDDKVKIMVDQIIDVRLNIIFICSYILMLIILKF